MNIDKDNKKISLYIGEVNEKEINKLIEFIDEIKLKYDIELNQGNNDIIILCNLKNIRNKSNSNIVIYYELNDSIPLFNYNINTNIYTTNNQQEIFDILDFVLKEEITA